MEMTRTEWLERLAKVDDILINYVYETSDKLHIRIPSGLPYCDIRRINDDVCHIVWVGNNYIHLEYALKDYGSYDVNKE